MAQGLTDRIDMVEAEFEQQLEGWKKVRERLQASVLHHVAENGDVPGPPDQEDVLHLVQALEIATRNERQVLLDLKMVADNTR